MTVFDRRAHLEIEKRYLRFCRKRLDTNPGYYQPQIDATLRTIERLETELQS